MINDLMLVVLWFAVRLVTLKKMYVKGRGGSISVCKSHVYVVLLRERNTHTHREREKERERERERESY